MSERDPDAADVLAANARFYEAFAGRDFPAMERLWAEDSDVTCVHPGWAVISDRIHVLESWGAILGNPESPGVKCVRPTVHWFGEVACVTCYEVVGNVILSATNIFVQENNRWRIVHHQAGPAAGLPEEEASPTSDSVH